MSVSRESSAKGHNKDKIKEQPQVETTKPEHTDLSKVLVKANRHPTLALVDLQTLGVDLINTKFVHLYCIRTRLSEKKTVTSTIQGS